MKDKDKLAKKFKSLRHRAQLVQDEINTVSPASAKEIQRLLHELETCQLELEMQNDDLRNAQSQLDESRQRFSDLYDFAPVGYLTIGKDGLVVQSNLTAEGIIGEKKQDWSVNL